MEDHMRLTLLLAATMTLTASLGIGPAAAATAPDVGWAKSQALAGSVVDQAAYHCGRWNWRCSKRWGFGSPRYARCMWRLGC
jgi:hypothetical protein